MNTEYGGFQFITISKWKIQNIEMASKSTKNSKYSLLSWACADNLMKEAKFDVSTYKTDWLIFTKKTSVK